MDTALAQSTSVDEEPAEATAETYRVFIGRIFISRVMSITYVHSARIG
jgi:hypothetical protein